MPPFQFDIFGAPPASIAPGLAAYSQGMSNAADITAQQGQMFEPLRAAAMAYMAQQHQAQMQAKALAEDYRQFKETQAFKSRELDAEEAYRREMLGLNKARMEGEMGWRTSAAETARRNADLRERGLDLEASRSETARLAEQRQRQNMEASIARDRDRLELSRQIEERNQAAALQQQATQRRLQAMAQLKMMGDPQAMLEGAGDPMQHGETERMLRDLFRGLGGEAPRQAPSPIQEIVPGMAQQFESAQMPSPGPSMQRPGLTQHPSDGPKVPRGTPKTAEPDQGAAEVALANEIAAQAKAKGWTREEARAAYLKAARAAGID